MSALAISSRPSFDERYDEIGSVPNVNNHRLGRNFFPQKNLPEENAFRIAKADYEWLIGMEDAIFRILENLAKMIPPNYFKRVRDVRLLALTRLIDEKRKSVDEYKSVVRRLIRFNSHVKDMKRKLDDNDFIEWLGNAVFAFSDERLFDEVSRKVSEALFSRDLLTFADFDFSYGGEDF